MLYEPSELHFTVFTVATLVTIKYTTNYPPKTFHLYLHFILYHHQCQWITPDSILCYGLSMLQFPPGKMIITSKVGQIQMYIDIDHQLNLKI